MAVALVGQAARGSKIGLAAPPALDTAPAPQRSALGLPADAAEP